MRSLVARLLRDGELEATEAQVLHGVGRGLRTAAPEVVERYWDLLLSVASPPSVTERIEMRLSAMTCQRQGLTEDSPRLARLTGLVKTVTGTVANRIVADHPGSVLVIEDLDLRGCRGQKRFAYRALETKAPVEVVNPAYTSQTCPSCGHVSRQNRRATQFTCVSCGRRAHADVVGATNLLGRSDTRERS